MQIRRRFRQFAGIEAPGLPEVRRPVPRPRRAGFEHLADLTVEQLNLEYQAAMARAAVLAGSDVNEAGVVIARSEASAEASALRDELRRRMAFRP